MYSLSTSRTVIPITSSLLALLSHRAYFVHAHCGVTCCSCFVFQLPLPSIHFHHLRGMSAYVSSQIHSFTLIIPSLCATLLFFPSRLFVLPALTSWLTPGIYFMYATRSEIRGYRVCSHLKRPIGIFIPHTCISDISLICWTDRYSICCLPHIVFL